MGSDVHIGPDMHVDDIFSMGGDVHIEGTVHGDCASAGGDIDVEGLVHGDVLSMGGDVHLSDTAQVLGEIHTMGGDISGAPHDRHHAYENDLESGDDEDDERSIFSRAAKHGVIFLLGLIMLGVSRERHARISLALVSNPIKAVVTGAFTFVFGLASAVALVLTLIGIPVSLFLLMAGFTLIYIGYAIIASVLGAALPSEKLKGRPITQLAAGTLILFVLSTIPVLNALIVVVGACAGFGAIVMTRFGREPDEEAEDA